MVSLQPSQDCILDTFIPGTQNQGFKTFLSFEVIKQYSSFFLILRMLKLLELHNKRCIEFLQQAFKN